MKPTGSCTSLKRLNGARMKHACARKQPRGGGPKKRRSGGGRKKMRGNMRKRSRRTSVTKRKPRQESKLRKRASLPKRRRREGVRPKMQLVSSEKLQKRNAAPTKRACLQNRKRVAVRRKKQPV